MFLRIVTFVLGIVVKKQSAKKKREQQAASRAKQTKRSKHGTSVRAQRGGCSKRASSKRSRR